MGVMRILYIADGRSPTALNWMSYFVERRHEVHLASTYPCQPELDLASVQIVPVAFSGAAGAGSGAASRGGVLRRVSTAGLRTKVRQWLGPLTLRRAARQLNSIYEQIQPDLIHAMRIPYEGMLAAMAEPNAPLLVSVWGNDFTLHAKATPVLAALTRRTMQRVMAVHADTRRDIRLAGEWGLPAERRRIVLPGAGGIQPEIFYPAETPPQAPVVINARGLRAYVRNDTFFKAIPRVLAKRPEARFVCPAMGGEAEADGWVNSLGIADGVQLLPRQSREQMAALFRQAQVAVSPSEHDGTPNSLLEAMACGCFPVAGDIDSLREWVTPGENGLLVDPGDVEALAAAIVRGLEDAALRGRAAAHNARLIAEKATFGGVMAQAESYYNELVSASV
ncbi:MAG: glycosyltransferase family 4 protein [Anaerolineae bacterium]|nr:glycosyltransferase family 4 protein [Anaerolineae bacterium]